MAVITNFGTMNYERNGVKEEMNSNIIQTNLNVSYSSDMLKAASPVKFSPAQRITYQIYLKNTGTGTFYNPAVTDNLGGNGYSPLEYVIGSVSAFLYDTEERRVSEIPVTETVTDENVTFKLDGNIPKGHTAIITFDADVDSELPVCVLEITNTAVFTADKGNTDSVRASYTDCASATITREPVSIIKSASADSVDPGDNFSYTFTLTNAGTEPVTVNNITDKLPENFKAGDIITAVIGDETAIYSKGTDFTISDSNELVIQPDSASIPLTIPAASNGKTGITTISIPGTITA